MPIKRGIPLVLVHQSQKAFLLSSGKTVLMPIKRGIPLVLSRQVTNHKKIFKKKKKKKSSEETIVNQPIKRGVPLDFGRRSRQSTNQMKCLCCCKTRTSSLRCRRFSSVLAAAMRHHILFRISVFGSPDMVQQNSETTPAIRWGVASSHSNNHSSPSSKHPFKKIPRHRGYHEISQATEL